MGKKLVYLVLLALVLSPVAAQAAKVEWIRAAYWDPRYTTGWADEVVSAFVRDGLEKAGYEILNADQLKAWMDARIADGKYSVVVLCRDRVPVEVVETRDANCTLRRYLDVGGKIVHYADIPFYNVAFGNYSAGQWADAGAPAILGFNTAGATRSVNKTVAITATGAAWGLTTTWASNRPATPDVTTDLEILAKDDTGNAAAWVKHYLPGDTFRGFVRIWDVDVTTTVRPPVDEIIRVAEYTGAGPQASNPRPADGATGVTIPVVQWDAAKGATAHQVYFGTDRAAVDAADTGSPEYKGQQPVIQNAYVFSSVAGMTYYWRVDEVLADGVTVSPGDVWSFTAASEAASAPKPADGATYVAPDVVLEWTPGMTATGHDVYFGTDRAAVEAGAAEVKKATAQPLASYTPAGLVAGTTYYWRVDEVAAATTPGEVWSFTVRPVIAKVDPNMIGWWKLDDEQAGVAVDSSGWDHHGTLMNGVQWAEGHFGDALRFDGIDDYVDCGTDASFNFSGSVTIAAWVKTGVSTSDAKIASNQNNSSGGYKFGVYGNKAEFEIRNASNASTLNRSVAGGTTLTPGVWYHVVGVYTLGQSIKTYVNGKLDREAATTEVLGASNGTFKIGRESFSASYYFLGWIDDVRIYNKALSDTEIVQVMHGDPLVASDPSPAHAVLADVLDAAQLSWAPGTTAAKHNVYFGKDKEAVKAADVTSPEFKAQQTPTSYSTIGQVEFGGGSYFWRVDEVEADGTTIHKGNVWRFTVPDYLIIDDFESYTNDSPTRVFQTWIDGYGYSADEFFPTANPGNGTGAGVGHDIWTAENNPFYSRTIMETVFTYDNLDWTTFYVDNFQSMPLYYDNASAGKKYYSEAARTWTEPQDLTAGGVTDLSLWFRGRPQKFVQNADGTLTASACSGDISGTNGDYFRFIYKTLNGDGSMIIKVNSLTFTANWTKCGVMIRESLDVASARAHMITLSNGRIAFENRPSTAGASASQYSAIGAIPLPVWLKLERKGNDFTGYYSTDGVNWTANVKGASGGGGAGTNPQTIAMAGSVLVGVCITSNNAGYAASAAAGTAGWGGLTAVAEISDVTTTASVTGDWTVADIAAAGLPNPANDADDLYVALQDTSGSSAVATWPDGAVQADWTNWVIPLSQFKGVNTSAVTKMSIGVGDPKNPQPDGAGMVLIDSVRVIKP
jgi:hypothetical protein